MLCRYYLLRLHFTAGYHWVEFFVLGSVSWGCQWRVPPYISCFSLVLWTSLVIHGLLANHCIGYFAVLSALLLNEKRVKSRSRKKKAISSFLHLDFRRMVAADQRSTSCPSPSVHELGTSKKNPLQPCRQPLDP